MMLSFLFPSRCLLFMGDDALRVYDGAVEGIRLVDSVPWSTEDFEDTLAHLIKDRCAGKPVLIVNDMVEQHYRKERIPSATIFDRASIVEHKLGTLFQSSPVRAALPLRKKKYQANRSLGPALPGKMYLFTGVPMTEALRKTVKAVEKSFSRIDGFILLPVEGAEMVTELAKKLYPAKYDPTRWTLLIGQHHGGSLRQVLVRDGELALTRMTPIIDTDLNPEDWGREVVQEFKATMGYLSRFGYETQDGLDTIVICGNAPSSYLQKHFGSEGVLHLMSALDAADMLGLKVGTQEDIRYADPIYAGWIGRKRNFALPLKPDFITRISIPREISLFSVIILIACSVWLLFNIFFDLQKANAVRGDLIFANQQKSMVSANLDQVKQREDETGYNFLNVETVVTLHEEIEAGRVDVANLTRRLGIALRNGVWFSAMRLSPSEINDFLTPEITQNFRDQNNAGDNIEPAVFDVGLDLALAADLTADEAFRLVNRVQDNLRQLFPNTEVTITEHIADVRYSDRVFGRADQARDEEQRVARTARILMRGIIE